ncbi:MAG: MarR family transcriptional regulator [Lachnospiraceae bacterium]|nr:MarR family transcriptional regulator [Lachnospiraceae bacterium]
MDDTKQSRDRFNIVMSFLRTDRFHRCAAESQVKKLGIHRSQHMMLMHLARCKEPQTQAELAKAFEISPAAVTVTLQKLEKAGYVTRTAVEGNNRAKNIAITPEGMDIVRQSWELYKALDEAMLAGLTEEDLQHFADVLDRMQENLRQYSPEVATLE